MSGRPTLFISAVSKELRSARGLASRLVHSLGYDPKDQDMARTEHGELCGVLRRWIDASDGVVQLVGQCYGEPSGQRDPALDPDLELSYTQYEARYALQQGKKVWYFFVGDGYQADPFTPEPAEHTQRQQRYIAAIKQANDIRSEFSSDDKLENLIHRLRDDLAQLRARYEQKLDTLVDQGAQNQAAIADMRQMLESLVRGGSEAKLTQDYEAALKFIAGRHQLSVEVLRDLLAQRASQAVSDPRVNLREKVEALRAAGQFVQARDFALEAALRLEAVRQQATRDEIEMWLEACKSEETLGHYPLALQHAQKAEQLANREQDFQTWAEARHHVGRALWRNGKAQEALALFQELVPLRTAQLGGEDPVTLHSRNNLANALDAQGKHAEAEAEQRAVLTIRERVQGAENPDTLMSRNNLANALYAQGKNAEAEAEHHAVLALRERVLGAEHPEAMNSRNNLAAALGAQGKYAEAVAELRAVLAIQERVLGAEHPDVFQSCYNLALCLEAQKKLPEALAFMQRAEAGFKEVLGTEHPYSKDAQRNRERIEAALRAK